MADVLPPELEEAHMRRALELARLGIGQTAPNPMVGAVLVRGGVVVGEGYHARFGEAIREALSHLLPRVSARAAPRCS